MVCVCMCVCVCGVCVCVRVCVCVCVCVLELFQSSQHIVDLGDIPGLEDNLVAQKEKAARTFAFKAFRCFHLAESYVGMQRWAESVGLFDRAQEHVTEALEHYRELEQEPGDSTSKIEGVRNYTGGVHMHCTQYCGPFPHEVVKVPQ